MRPSLGQKRDCVDRLVAGSLTIAEATVDMDVSEASVRNWVESRERGLFKKLRARERSRKRMAKYGGAVEWILTTDEKPTMSAASKKFGLDYQRFTLWVIAQPGVSVDVKAAMDKWKDKNLPKPEYAPLPERLPLTRESLAERRAVLAGLAERKDEADKALDAALADAEGSLF